MAKGKEMGTSSSAPYFGCRGDPSVDSQTGSFGAVGVALTHQVPGFDTGCQSPGAWGPEAIRLVPHLPAQESVATAFRCVGTEAWGSEPGQCQLLNKHGRPWASGRQLPGRY